jgi:hypothetical protein
MCSMKNLSSLFKDVKYIHVYNYVRRLYSFETRDFLFPSLSHYEA